MKKEEFKYLSANKQTNIRALRYIPEKKIVAVLQIAHGMVEFIDRYEDFAKYLCDRGFLVTGNDHLGHGGSVNSEDEWGYFGDNGNQILLDDMHKLYEITKEKYPDVPYFLMGHSMGSFYARQYMFYYGSELDGVIVMGTGMEPLYMIKSGMLLCKCVALFKGWKYRSELVNGIAFGSYNKKFEPARTKVDWLTKDEKVVDWYLNEPRCNFMFTLDGYYNMFSGICKLYDKDLIDGIPKDLPVLFVSGQDDPVGAFGKEVIRVHQTLIDHGMRNIRLKLYPNDRHEILNETDKENVYEDIYEWLNDVLQNSTKI